MLLNDHLKFILPDAAEWLNLHAEEQPKYKDIHRKHVLTIIAIIIVIIIKQNFVQICKIQFFERLYIHFHL